MTSSCDPPPRLGPLELKKSPLVLVLVLPNGDCSSEAYRARLQLQHLQYCVMVSQQSDIVPCRVASVLLSGKHHWLHSPPPRLAGNAQLCDDKYLFLTIAFLAPLPSCGGICQPSQAYRWPWPNISIGPRQDRSNFNFVRTQMMSVISPHKKIHIL